VRDQYVGDVSDLLKYALLRMLASDDRRLGVAWYYNPNCDKRRDGRHSEYLGEDKWVALDANLWSALRNLSKRSVAAVEQLAIWPPTVRFHHEPIPDWRLRAGWAAGMAYLFAKADLVFLDPDNGVGRVGKRHATLDEVRLLRRPGQRALVLIKFPGRTPFDEQEDVYCDAIRRATGTSRLITLRTYVSVPNSSGGKVPRFRWFTMIDHDDVLARRFASFADKLNSIPGASAFIRPE
jgi:hypothetical protein